jgi:cysteine desulfurase/selenocysteine lyase
MIERVSFDGTTFNSLPYKFEAGTPHIAGVIGLGAAIDYVLGIDRVGAAEHEAALLSLAEAHAAEVEGLRIIGTAANKISVMSFLIEGTHPSDVGALLDQQGVAVRTGHHCAQPIMAQYGITGTIRASFSIYNTEQDVTRLFAALAKARTFLF